MTLKTQILLDICAPHPAAPGLILSVPAGTVDQTRLVEEAKDSANLVGRVVLS